MPNSATHTLLVSSENTVYEYTLTGTLVDSFTIPDNPDREAARDLVIDRDGNLQVFNGTFDPFLSTYNVQSEAWSHQTYTDWAIVNNGTYGGITTYQNYVYLSDMLRDSEGIIRVDLNDGSAQRLATSKDFIDLSIGLDNKLYALESYGRVTIYDPLTLAELESFKLSHTGGFRAVAANADGDMFFADWGGQLHHYDSAQTLVKSAESGISGLYDLDLAPDGMIAIGSRFGKVLVTDESFSSPTSLQVGDQYDGTFVAFKPLSSSVPDENDGEQQQEATGEISGLYWIDGNYNGVQENEERQAGKSVYLDLNNNRQHDADEPSTVTDEQGEYAFQELDDGTYTVVFETEEAHQTIPNGAGSVLIPVTNYRDLIYDNADDLLYITTDDGDIERFSLTNRQLLSPLDVGVKLNGGDITEDGAFLFVAEERTANEKGNIYKVNLETHAVQSLPYDLTFYEGGAWDVTLAANGTGFVSTLFRGSGSTPIRELNSATGTLTIRDDAGTIHNEVSGKTRIHRSGDRSTLFFTEPNSSRGPMSVYNASTDQFPVDGATNRFLGNVAAVNRDGSILALPENGDIKLYSPNLFVLDTLDVDGRIAFDPTQDILYVADTNRNQVIAFDTTSWDELYRFNVIGGVANVAPHYTFDQGMAVSDDGQFLFVPTTSGIRAFEVGSYRLNRQAVTVSTTVSTGGGTAGGNFQGALTPTSIPSLQYRYTSPSGREGAESSLGVSFVDDASATRHTLKIDWGDGSVEEFELEDSERRLASQSHIYSQDGTYTRTITIDNGHGEVLLDQSDIEIENVAPVLEVQGEQTVVEDEPYSLVLSATDPGDDEITLTVDWGDRTLETITEAGEQRHVYAEPGDYDVVITADDGTDTTEETLRIVVSAIPSPEVPDPDLDPDCEIMEPTPDNDEHNSTDSSSEDSSTDPLPPATTPQITDEVNQAPTGSPDNGANPLSPNPQDDAANQVPTDSQDDVANQSLTDSQGIEPDPVPSTTPPNNSLDLILDTVLFQETTIVVFEGDAARKPDPIDFTQGRKGIQRRGSNQGDLLHGSFRNDVLKGLKGNDRLRGYDGNDKLLGGRGDDILRGGFDNDKLRGGKGDDVLEGDKGNDVLLGGNKGDHLLGGAGTDVLIGGKGADVLAGGSGQDVFEYNRLKEGGDTIKDFNPNLDLIDLTTIFTQDKYAASTAAEQLNQFVQLIQIGSSTEIKVDVDGSGDRSKMISLATLNYVSMTSLDTSNFILG